MTIQELEFLRNSMRDAGDAFARNREMNARQKESDLDRAMRQQAFNAQQDNAIADRDWRTRESEKDRALRQGELDANRDWRAELKAAQAESNAEQREARIFGILGEMNQAGALTDEGLAFMQAQVEEKFGPAGIGVKLFRRPPERPASRSSEAQNLALAEDYRTRAVAAKDPQEKTRLMSIAERLERGGTPERDTADISFPFGPANPLTGEQAGKITRKVPASDLEAEMKRLTGQPEAVQDAPTDPKARKPGTVYQTPKGALKWTGTGWVKP